MTLTNKERITRCEEALNSYSDDDTYTNLVDWLADALHWCRSNKHDMAAAMDTALLHFDAEMMEEA
jgi:prephenate dehydrogenase